MTEATGKPRGFAAISPERRREIASRGGKAAHAAGTAHVFSSEEARVAGRKGGLVGGKSSATRRRCVRCGKVATSSGSPRICTDGATCAPEGSS